MKIFLVDLVNGTAFTLDVQSDFSIKKVKFLAQQEKGESMQSIKLSFKGIILDDHYTLGELNINSSSALMVEYTTASQTKNLKRTVSQITTLPRRELKIKILYSSGEALCLTAFSNTLGLKIFETIHKREGIPLKRQRLMFEGRAMQHDRTLEEHGIEDGDTIHLVLSMAGS